MAARSATDFARDTAAVHHVHHDGHRLRLF
jgi:hypothetical protein